MKYIVTMTMLFTGIVFSQQAIISPLGPDGGVISHLDGSFDDNVVIAIARDHNAYRSVDGGNIWSKINTPDFDTANPSVYDMAFHPTSPNIILLSTSIGLFRSEDMGASWFQVQGFPAPKFSVKYVPGVPNVVFGSDEAGVLRSFDGGMTWEPLNDGDRPIFQIAVHPGDSSVPSLRIIASRGFDDTTGVILSTDGGNTWKPHTKGLPTGGARRVYVMELDGTGLAAKDFRVIIGTADGVYAFQTDQSDTLWQSIKRTDPNFPIQGVVTSGLLRFDPTDTTGKTFDLFIATNASEYDGPPRPSATNNGIFKISSFAGTISTSFSAIKNLYPQLVGDITSIFIPIKSVNRNKIYLGTTNGVFISEDDGASWQPKNKGINNSAIRNIASYQSAAGIPLRFAGVYGGGVYRSTDVDTTWTSVSTGLKNPYVTTVVSDESKNYLYAGTPYTLYRSTNAGATWQAIYTPDSAKIVNWNAFSTRRNEMTVRVSQKNPDYLMFYSPAYGLNVRTLDGSPWTYTKSPPGFDSIHIPENIEFDPVDPQTIYFTGYGIYKSTNLGQTWSDISSDLPKQMYSPSHNRQVAIEALSPTINPLNTKEIFLSTVFSEEDGQAFRLFRTANGGSSWDTLSQMIPVYDVHYDRLDTKRLIASGPGGIFATIDGGASWKAIANPQVQHPYYLLGAHPLDANLFFVGSENGAYKIELTDRSKLTIDTAEYNFGSIQIGYDTTLTIYLRNSAGARNVIVQFIGNTDTGAFHYLGPDTIDIAAGSVVPFQVQFKPASAGNRAALLRFRTSEPLLDTIKYILRGNAYERYSLEKFTYDFGSVTVGKDSIVEFDIDNQYGREPITLKYVGNSDTVSFRYEGNPTVLIDTGQIAYLPVRFTPASTGVKQAYIAFTTTDPKFPAVKLHFQGTGVARNFMTRRVLIPNVGFISNDSANASEYFKFLLLSLERADIKVDTEQRLPLAEYHAVAFIQPDGPPPQDAIDSIRMYVMNGGTVITMGDHGPQAALIFNTVLHDSTWKKQNLKTGILYNSDIIIDTTLQDPAQAGYIAAVPAGKNILTSGIDSVVLFIPGSLKIDTAANNVIPLLVTKGEGLISLSDTTIAPVSAAVIAAYSQVGKGKIIAISDIDVWRNGYPDDTTHQYGIFSGNNLRFAFNIFGLIDNLLTRLPEPTPQEAYQLLSIPYGFKDSSVLALFKDLGPPNELVWRLFGRWNDRNESYEEFPHDFKSIRRGEGYWLITKEPTTINFGTTDVQGTEGDFEIALQPGFNMIGNPFPYEVSWANSFKEDSVEHVVWSFNGAFDSTSSTMEPFRGYFIKNRGKLAKHIRISSAQMTSTPTLPKDGPGVQLDPQEWKMQISASSAKASDERNYIGMLKDARDGFDKNDFSEPPTAPSDFVSLSIRNNGERLAADFRTPSREGQYWDVSIASSIPNIPVTVSMQKFGSLPFNFKVYMLDKAKERVYDVTQSLSHTLTFGKKEYSREVRIIVGSQKYADENTNGIPIVPLEYSLSQNYPNPFNPTTSIRYAISNSGHVKLQIFNMLGQEVKTLVQQFQPIGTYLVEWDGTGAGKIAVASGVYYCRLQANNYISVKKMTLIK